jgi:hypothetical protein
VQAISVMQLAFERSQTLFPHLKSMWVCPLLFISKVGQFLILTHTHTMQINANGSSEGSTGTKNWSIPLLLFSYPIDTFSALHMLHSQGHGATKTGMLVFCELPPTDHLVYVQGFPNYSGTPTQFGLKVGLYRLLSD